MINYGKQEVTEEDINAVIEVLKSDYLTQGIKVSEFENAFAEYVGSKHAIAVSSGTAALHLCALSLGISKGDKVITTPMSFSATSNCIRYCNGEVVFSDIDYDTGLIDIEEIKSILKNSKPGEFKGIIPVNFSGRIVNLEELKKIAKKYNLWIIEDSCHSLGGYLKNKQNLIQKSGDCSYSDLSIFSFHPVKHITTGEGGMITTNSKKLYDKIKILRTHGIDKSNGTKYPNEWYYEMNELGFNYRISDINCALGISQLKRIDQNLKKRKLIALKYIEKLSELPLETIQIDELEGHANHLFIIKTQYRDDLYYYLKKRNINCQVHYIPIYKMPYYQKIYGKQTFINTEKFYERCLSLPIYPSLNDEEQDQVIKQISNFFKKK